MYFAAITQESTFSVDFLFFSFWSFSLIICRIFMKWFTLIIVLFFYVTFPALFNLLWIHINVIFEIFLTLIILYFDLLTIIFDKYVFWAAIGFLLTKSRPPISAIDWNVFFIEFYMFVANLAEIKSTKISKLSFEIVVDFISLDISLICCDIIFFFIFLQTSIILLFASLRDT